MVVTGPPPPKPKGPPPDKDVVLARMMDPSLFTGSHKHRFDENGKGKGISDRQRVGMVPSMFLTGGADPDVAQKELHQKSSSAKNDETLKRLTDPKLYTSTHKHRFDKNGNGLGLAGRDRIIKGLGTWPTVPYLGGPIMDIIQVMRTPPPERVYPKASKAFKPKAKSKDI